ncbi:hypothetical protein UFOVP1369_34 [uncultured Caudovirales phage]|uniref:Uncharacterized protein n=1 Tax=uncultured Caudovirales phage TaxID=2100421 RepID=A0A6J5RWC3_9CAUD|nr:hypothetical protein UFOVP1369_34 [uncultured Caudovirales phage]
MTNIASNEDSGFDVVGKWISREHCHLTFRLNEDGMGETEIDYDFDKYDLAFLRDVITEFLDTQPQE